MKITFNIILIANYFTNRGSLHEVCIWKMPFPPPDACIEREGSPNVCFETDCNGVCENTEIEEYKKEVLSIFQNPATHQLSIDFNEAAGENTSIMLFDITGKIVYSEILDYTTPSTHTIKLSSLWKGLYLIKICNEQCSYTEKLIIME